MESRDIKDLHPDLADSFNTGVAKWKQFYPSLPTPFLTCTHRPDTDQTKLYAQGRTTKGRIVTYARAGQSPHNRKPSFAYDIAFKKQDGSLDWNSQLFTKFAALISDNNKVVWGGTWPDPKTDNPHFELKKWKTLTK